MAKQGCVVTNHMSQVCVLTSADLLNPLGSIEPKFRTTELESKKSPNGICRAFIVTVTYFYIKNIIANNIKWQTWRQKICYLVTLLIFKSHTQKLPLYWHGWKTNRWRIQGSTANEKPLFASKENYVALFFSPPKKYAEEVKISHFFIVDYHRCILPTFWTRSQQSVEFKANIPWTWGLCFHFCAAAFFLDKKTASVKCGSPSFSVMKIFVSFSIFILDTLVHWMPAVVRSNTSTAVIPK